MNFQNRVVVVSGGSTGIGKTIAQIFAANNAQVVIIGRRQHVLQVAAEEIGHNCSWHQVDVSQSNQVIAAVTAILGKYGKIDVLVNNAGFVLGETTTTPFDEAERAWDDEIGTNLKGAFLMLMTVAPHLPRPRWQACWA